MTISVEELARKISEACGVAVYSPPKPVEPAAPSPTAAAPAAPAAPAPAPAPAPAAPALCVQLVDFNSKGFNLDASVPPGQVVKAAEVLDKAGFGIDAVTGVDWVANAEMEVVYDYFHPQASCRAVVRARVPRANPEIPTISHVFPGADWHERETYDFFGIQFVGHPNLTRILLPEDADFHPLRKDFAP